MKAKRTAVWSGFALGIGLAIGMMSGLAEAYLQVFPTKECKSYVSEVSPLSGALVPDDAFGVAFRSWESFYTANAELLRAPVELQGEAKRSKPR